MYFYVTESILYSPVTKLEQNTTNASKKSEQRLKQCNMSLGGISFLNVEYLLSYNLLLFIKDFLCSRVQFFPKAKWIILFYFLKLVFLQTTKY